MEEVKKKCGRPKKNATEKIVRQWVSLPFSVNERWPSGKIVQLVMDTDSGNVSADVAPVVVASAEGSVKSKVEQLREAMGGKVVKASELTEDTFKVVEKPFGETPSSVRSATKLSNPQHNALVDRFVDILKLSTPDGLKAISAQLSQWQEQSEGF